MRLPAMAKEPLVDPEKSQISIAESDRPVSQDSSSQIASRLGDQSFDSLSTPAMEMTRSPLPISGAQRFKPPEQDGPDENDSQTLDRSSITSSAHGRLSPDRPPSPTKGLGGFVQSAMMKRSDSVSKRWSTQAGTSLKRGDSTASNRMTLGPFAGVPLTKPGSPPRESKTGFGLPTSPSTNSRPDSSHSAETTVQNQSMAEQPKTSMARGDALASNVSSLASSSDARGNTIKPSQSETREGLPLTPPTEKLPISPTKTMEPKRWSPTKASWLESALSKPESPKLTSPKPEQPTWLVDLQNSKQSKTSSGAIKPPASTFDMVNPSGFLRSPPMGGHSRPLSVEGLPDGFSSGVLKKTPATKPKPKRLSEESVELETSVPPQGFPDDLLSKPSIVSPAEAHPESKTNREGPVVKPKPQTPPKTDFRTNLKSRQKESPGLTSSEPEFKSMLGNLRRTETKNYVPPDELKGNILRGKGALNLTGGPQKTKRVDEFKESLVEQKEAMRSSGGSIRKKNADEEVIGVKPPPKPSPVLPEALRKRSTLNKPTRTVGDGLSTKPSNSPNPAEIQPLSFATRSTERPVTAQVTKPSKYLESPFSATTVKTSSGIEHLQATSEESSPPKQEKWVLPEASSSMDLMSTSAPVPVPVAISTEATAGTGKLANRFNPTLVSILSRGPPSTSSSRNQSTEDLSGIEDSTRLVDSPSGGQIVHMTKGRARGPKRRLPKGANEVIEQPQTQGLRSSKLSKSLTASSPEARGSNPTSLPRKPLVDLGQDRSLIKESPTIALSRPLATLVNKNEKTNPNEHESPLKGSIISKESKAPTKEKPVVAAKSPELRKVSSPKNQSAAAESTTLSPKTSGKLTGSPVIQEKVTPHESNTLSGYKTKKAVENKAGKSLSVLQPKLGPKPSFDNLDLSKAILMPVKEQADPNISSEVKQVSLNGLGLSLNTARTTAANLPSPEPTPPKNKISKQRSLWGYPVSRSGELDGNVLPTSTATKVGHPEAAQILGSFFDEQPKLRDKASTDTQAVISSVPDTIEKIRTVRMQIWEVNGDGKRQDMPPQQEHILFEECMYLCVHSFENAKGSKAAEVYLWCGDRVGEASVEDAQLFCRKVARENSSKLELLKQGKETALFIQALGGIIITRRAKSAALYMLCGRRHLGHVTFDELDLDPKSLCSGFPYLISAKFGKLYLWKGKGSGADELGCARLIGMDLGLTGEIEEITEGEEPAQFWEAFPGTRIAPPDKPSEHWTLKACHDQYSCRLFCVESERQKPATSFWTRRGSSPPKSTKTALVQEISPFCQRDIEASHVYLLDAYFDIFV